MAYFDAVMLIVSLLISYTTRAMRFQDAYRKELNGKQAAWACKKYRGHRTLPMGILEELSKAGI